MATLLVIGGNGFFGKSILDMFQRGGLSAWGVDKVIAMARNTERLKDEVPELLKGKVFAKFNNKLHKLKVFILISVKV